MIVARLYAMPVPGGTVLVASELALADLAAGAHLVAMLPPSLGVDVYVAAPLPEAAVVEPARVLLRRAAAAATFPASVPPLGPQGRWYAVLVIWGWLALLGASQSVAQVLGGLWLAFGLPWARRAQRRRTDRWPERAASALGTAFGDVVPVRQLVHTGLQRLTGVLEAASGPAEERLRAGAIACVAAGVPHLASFYLALAQGHRPAGTWAFVPAEESEGTGRQDEGEHGGGARQDEGEHAGRQAVEEARESL